MSYLDAVEDAELLDSEVSEQLVDIKEAIKFLAEKAMGIIPPGMSKERARAYWYAHIVTSLDKDNDFFGNNACQMQDTIEELQENE